MCIYSARERDLVVVVDDDDSDGAAPLSMRAREGSITNAHSSHASDRQYMRALDNHASSLARAVAGASACPLCCSYVPPVLSGERGLQEPSQLTPQYQFVLC